uniref:Rhodanese domain-containing protein n=1 Tax=Rhizophora mucronata TaxID=61149 RepID=A0A2P2M2T7_RHIMU
MGQFVGICINLSGLSIEDERLVIFIQRSIELENKMLPVCTATPSLSSYPQILFYGGLRSLSKDFEARCIVEDRVVYGLLNGMHLQGATFKTQASKSFYSSVFESNTQPVPISFTDDAYFPSELNGTRSRFYNNWGYSVKKLNEHISIGTEGTETLRHAEGYSISSVDGVVDPVERLTISADNLVGPVEPETMSATQVASETPSLLSNSLNVTDNSLSGTRASFDDILAGAKDSISNLVNTGENTMKSSLDTITSSIISITESASKAMDDAFSTVSSTVDQTGALTGTRLTSFSNVLKEATSKASTISVDVLRGSIIAVEDSIVKGASFLVSSYGTTKELLPPEIRDTLNVSEERAAQILDPVGFAFQQVYTAVKGLEERFGLNPNDPIVSFVLFLGISATLWGFYWAWNYTGYSGDLSPQSTLELLKENENALLIDVRPEALREINGIPDLRRAARFRYAGVTLPEVDGSLKKLLRQGREIDDALIAAVICNLKAVKDRSKVIVMDADGTQSKGLARFLRKLGVKSAYLVQGGFQSWAKQGLRVKELKPETTLTILNEVLTVTAAV